MNLWLGLVGCADTWTLTVVPHTIAGQDPFAGAPLVDVWAELGDGTVGVAELGTAEAERILEASGALPEGGFVGLYVHEPDDGVAAFGGLRAWGRAETPPGVQGGDGDVTLDVLVPLSHAAGQLGAFDPESRRFFAAAALLDGGDVLLAGGVGDPNDAGSGRTEINRLGAFDGGAPTSEALGKLPDGMGLVDATATRVARGDQELVFYAGGRAAAGEGPERAWALLDPQSGAAVAQGDLVTARAGHHAVMLPSGEVLLAGGAQGDDVGLVEIFDPVSGVARMATQGVDLADVGPGVADLGGGVTLICGGASVCDDDEAALALCPLVDEAVPVATCVEVAATGTATTVAALPVATAGLALASLGDGRVLAVGGVTGRTVPGDAVTATAKAWLREVDGSWRGIGSSGQPRIHHALATVGNGNVLLVGGSTVGRPGGIDDVDAVPCIEVFDPATETFSEVLDGCAPMATGARPTLSQATSDGLFVVGGARAAGASWDGADGWGLVGLGP